MADNPASYAQYAFPVLIVAAVLALRLRAMGKTRALRIDRLWIVPALYALMAAALFTALPPHGIGWLYCALALLAGLAIGWQRGRLMHIAVDPASGALVQKMSPAALLLIVGLVGLRFGLRAIIGGPTAGGGGASGAGMQAMLLADVLIAMALGFLSAQRLEMYLRAKRLLAEAMASRPAG